jgi:hypothetical protein
VSLPPSDVLAALNPVVDLLERLRVPYHIGGSLASSAYGVPRASADVDVIAELELDHVDRLVAGLQEIYFVDRERVLEAVRRRESFNLIHLHTMMKVDVFVPERALFSRQEQARARREVFDVAQDARAFWVKSPEDLVLRKLSWYRTGGEASERQWSDVLGVLKVQAERLDRDYLSHWASELRVLDLLERALSEASR